ncbi:amino acid adenylation domain-containing protein, partial [bacterium]|nr:amino acid adenylation domain-containing protein [bacterium]
LFEESVFKGPDRIAIVYESQQLSYRVLNDKSNQLAHYLIKQGVTFETPVAISTVRSPDLIIGLLAILKSGGTYVPLDPEYPDERLQYMLDDSKSRVLLTTLELQGKFKKTEDVYSRQSELSIIAMDDLAIQQELDKQSKTNLNLCTPGNSLCYIIYTSGSTGKPKGVGVRSDAFYNTISYFYRSINSDLSNDLLSVTTISFDIAQLEFFLPFVSGGKLYITNYIQQEKTALILSSIHKYKPDTLQAVPSLFASFNEYSKNIEKRPNIHHVICGGEALNDIVEEYVNSISEQSWNVYGPTESTIWSTSNVISQANSIGKPIYNTQIYILDSHLNAVPIGVIGEIYIGGVGLARGYIGKAGLTAEKFIANPFVTEDVEGSSNIGSRLYKTGDLARYLPDGNIEFIGRVDHQVKIRGFRIELGEIESVLSDNKDVSQAVVLAREDIVGQKRLVGYVTLNKEITRSFEKEEELIASLREQVSKSLPDYMQLAQIIILDEFPLTQNGKLDRKALPSPEGREGIGLYQAPEGPIEEKLASIWSELLNVDKVGRNDN